MENLLYTLFGEGKELNSLQMGCRAFAMFCITLVLIRIAGMRAFGQKSAFDTIIAIMLGAILSRAVTGASPFFPTTTAGAVLAVVHRLIGVISVYSSAMGYLAKGKKVLLFDKDKFIKRNMIFCSVSGRDLMEEVRINLHESTMENVKEIYMERSGKISIIKKG